MAPKLKCLDVRGDVTRISFLEASGFECIGSVGELCNVGLPTNQTMLACGLYAVSLPQGFTPRFIPLGQVRERCNVIKPRNADFLTRKWVRGVDIVYYGIAGLKSDRSLKERLSDLLKHAKGKTSASGPHGGGEILWQLSGYEALSIWVIPTKGAPTPKLLEKSVLRAFRNQTGMLPFANNRL